MRKTVLDLAWGFIAFAAVLAVSFLTREHQDIRSFALATCFAFFGAAFYRARVQRQMPWLSPLLIALGGIAPVVAMNRFEIAFTDPIFFLSFLLISVGAAILGAGVQRLMARGQSSYPIALSCLSIVAVYTSVFVAIPHWIASSAYRDVNEALAPFTVETLAGKNMSSEEWKGHVVIIAFWATWCTPCQAELPEIAALKSKFSDNPNVLILALNSGNHGETASKAQEYIAKRKLSLKAGIDSYGVLPGEDSWGPGAKSLGVESLPAIYILDRSGRLRVVHLGYDPSEHLADSLAEKNQQPSVIPNNSGNTTPALPSTTCVNAEAFNGASTPT